MPSAAARSPSLQFLSLVAFPTLCWKTTPEFGQIDDIRWFGISNLPLLGAHIRSLKNCARKTPVQITVGLNRSQQQATRGRPDHRISSICPNLTPIFQQAGVVQSFRT